MKGEEETYSTGRSNFEHHFGRARAGTFEEQLILHDWVSHGIKPLLLTVTSGAAAALAAGEDNEGGLGAVELIAGGPLCGTTGSGTGGSLRDNKLPVAHPPSAKIRITATSLINSFYSFNRIFENSFA
jgi:hypothetical protein